MCALLILWASIEFHVFSCICIRAYAKNVAAALQWAPDVTAIFTAQASSSQNMRRTQNTANTGDFHFFYMYHMQWNFS